MMHKNGIMHIEDAPACLTQPIAQVSILTIEKIVLIKQGRVAVGQAAQAQASSHHLLHLDGRVEIPPSAPVATEQARAWEEPRQEELLAEHCPEGQLAGAGGLNPSVRIAQLPTTRRRFGVRVHKLDQACQRTGHRPHIGVQHEQVVSLRLL
jgi:hypothetical protein